MAEDTSLFRALLISCGKTIFRSKFDICFLRGKNIGTPWILPGATSTFNANAASAFSKPLGWSVDVRAFVAVGRTRTCHDGNIWFYMWYNDTNNIYIYVQVYTCILILYIYVHITVDSFLGFLISQLSQIQERNWKPSLNQVSPHRACRPSVAALPLTRHRFQRRFRRARRTRRTWSWWRRIGSCWRCCKTTRSLEFAVIFKHFDGSQMMLNVALVLNVIYDLNKSEWWVVKWCWMILRKSN